MHVTMEIICLSGIWLKLFLSPLVFRFFLSPRNRMSHRRVFHVRPRATRRPELTRKPSVLRYIRAEGFIDIADAAKYDETNA